MPTTTEQEKESEALDALRKLLEDGEKREEYDHDNLGFDRHSEPSIVLPEHMSHEEAAEHIRERGETLNEWVRFRRSFDDTWPTDGLVAFNEAISEVFGFASRQAKMQTFFGSMDYTPREMLVDTGPKDGDKRFVNVDRLEPPALDGGYIDPDFDLEGGFPSFVLTFKVRSKHRDLVESFADKVDEILRERSIYRGQALEVNLSFAYGEDFDIKQHSPAFLDVETEIDPLILNPDAEFALETSVLQRIRSPEKVRSLDIPLNHGVLLDGPYGTGKTLTALHVARECVKHNWTFIMVDDPRELSAAFRFAQRYAPAVIFGEDIDRAAEKRDDLMNEILQRIDGLASKNEDILTILTTNYPERIDPSFLRAGRIDTRIHLGTPKPQTITRFIEQYIEDQKGTSVLEDGADLTEAAEAMEGFVPAFIAEAVRRAKMYALERDPDDPVVTAEDLRLAGESLQKHAEMAALDRVEDKAHWGDEMVENIRREVNGNGAEAVEAQ